MAKVNPVSKLAKEFANRVFARKKSEEIRNVVSDEILDLFEFGNELRREFVSTWQENKTDFETLIERKGKKIIFKTKVIAPILVGSTEGLTAYEMLNEGTQVRRALLSPDWQSKTKVGQISSGKGRGMVVAVKPHYSFKGIEARGVEEKIRKSIDKDIQARITKAVSKGLSS